jgi:hypothetical protein
LKPANVFKYENRLAKTMVKQGGMTSTAAVAAAVERVEQVRLPTLADIDATLGLIYENGPRIKGGGNDPFLAAVYSDANHIVAIAAVFDLPALGEAAYSLCELISRFQAGGNFNAGMVAVHLDGLRMLRRPTGQADRVRILGGLRMVVEAVSRPAQAS